MFPPDLAVSPDGASIYVADPSYGSHGAAYRIDLFLPVRIAIQPHDGSKDMRPYTRDVVSVAVLATADFDLKQVVDPASVRFGPHEAPEMHDAGHLEDVDGDGRADLLLYFVSAHTGVACGDWEARLRGVTFRGIRFQGRASIQTIDCR